MRSPDENGIVYFKSLVCIYNRESIQYDSAFACFIFLWCNIEETLGAGQNLDSITCIRINSIVRD